MEHSSRKFDLANDFDTGLKKKKKEFNWVGFKDFIGFIQLLVNRQHLM